MPWFAIFVWSCLGVLAVLSGDAGDVSEGDAVLALGGLSMLLGAWGFLRHGGPRITATGVYHLAFALFVGFAAFYLLLSPGPVVQVDLKTPMAYAYFVHVVITAATWRTGTSHPRPVPSTAGRGVASWGVLTGAALLTLSVVLSRGGYLLNNAALGVVPYAGVMLVAVAVICSRQRPRLRHLLIAAAAFGAYTQLVFINSGRLILGSLGIGIAIAVSARVSLPLLKPSTVLAVAVGLTALARSRSEYIATRYAGLPGVPRETGFESVVSPLYDFARLLEFRGDGTLPLAHGETFFAALVAFVPRELWSAKPVGLGSELVAYLAPAQVGTGHSVAVLDYGEWYYNFGLLGFVPMMVLSTIGLRFLDRGLALAVDRPIAGKKELIGLTIWVVLASSVVHQAWTGAFTYATRGILVAMILGALLIAAPAGRVVLGRGRRDEDPEPGARLPGEAVLRRGRVVAPARGSGVGS